MATGRENLVLAGPHPGHDRAAAARPAPRSCSTASTSTDAADRLVKTYSGGMARKLDVAIGLVHRPARALPRRADHRARPRGARRDVGRDRAAGRGRAGHRAAHHALPRRGRPARRPAGDRRPRPGRRRGHAGRAQERAARRHRAVVELGSRRRRDRRRSAARRAARAARGRRRTATHAAGPGRQRRARRPAGRSPPSRAAACRSPPSTVARPSLDDVYLRHAGRTFEWRHDRDDGHRPPRAVARHSRVPRPPARCARCGAQPAFAGRRRWSSRSSGCCCSAQLFSRSSTSPASAPTRHLPRVPHPGLS